VLDDQPPCPFPNPTDCHGPSGPASTRAAPGPAAPPRRRTRPNVDKTRGQMARLTVFSDFDGYFSGSAVLPSVPRRAPARLPCPLHEYRAAPRWRAGLVELVLRRRRAVAHQSLHHVGGAVQHFGQLFLFG